MPGLIECACVRRLLRREICCLQHGETESNVWNTFVWSCPTWPSRWGMRISIDWPRLKSCQTVCDECMRGEIYSSLSQDAGCSAMWTWWESCVTKIWGSEHDHGFVLFLFATTGFYIARSGNFLDPNIRVIRGPYCKLCVQCPWSQVPAVPTCNPLEVLNMNLGMAYSTTHLHPTLINPLSSGRCGCNFNYAISNSFWYLIARVFLVMVPSGKCLGISLVISQHSLW